MKQTLTLAVLILPIALFAQQKSDLNLGFETLDDEKRIPLGATRWGSGYSISADSLVKRSGKFSLRIQAGPDRQAGAFGSSALLIPGSFEAKQIELRGYMKIEDVRSGAAGLLLRVDGMGRSLAFDNMHRRNIQGTSDWTPYTITLPYPSEGRSMYVGAILNGTGTVWVDDLQVLLDGKDISEAKPRALLKAELDNQFDASSGISHADLSGTSVADLVLLGKVWGFLKYHHSKIASGDLNWDYELFRVLPEYVKSESKETRNKVLLSWIERFGPVEKGTPAAIDSTVVKLRPDLAWISDKSELGSALTASLEGIREAKRSDEHFYIQMFERVGNPIFKNEQSYRGMQYPDPGFRLLSVFRYWNIIQYFFPYKHLAGDWNATLPEFIPRFLNASNGLEYKLAALEMICRIHDTHAGIWADTTIEHWKGNFLAPINLRFVEGKPVVTEYSNDRLGKESGLQIGDVILSVDGVSVDEIVKQRLHLTSASNHERKLFNLGRDLLRSPDSLLTVGFQRDGKRRRLDVRCYGTAEIHAAGDSRAKHDPWKTLSGNIGYIFTGNIKNDTLPGIMAALKDTRGLIIDLRTYPSDFITYTLADYLLPNSVDFAKFTGGTVENPGLFKFRSGSKVGHKRADFYRGKVAILVNELTLSNAEFTAMSFRTTPNAVVIGSTTAAADGNVSQIVLPGGIFTGISGIGVYYPDGRETQRVGIVPDIVVRPTIKGIREGRDEVLEKAVEVVGK